MPSSDRKKPDNDAWLVILLILFLITIAVFLAIVLNTVKPTYEDKPAKGMENQQPPVINKAIDTPTPKPLNYLEERSGPHALFHGDLPVGASDILRFSNIWISNHLKSMPDELPVKEDLAGIPIQSVRIGRSFYIYDVKLIPVDNTFHIVILMELPRIDIVLSQPYSTYYPSINPYIHVVEFTFRADLDNKTTTLVSMSIYTVDWETNRYKTMYEQTRNSPVCLPDMPEPLNLSKEELSRFIWRHKIFDEIAIHTENGLYSRPVQQSSVSTEPPKMKNDSVN